MDAGTTTACPGDKEISSFRRGGSDAKIGGTVSIGKNNQFNGCNGSIFKTLIGYNFVFFRPS